MNALATSFARRIADHAQSEGGRTEVIQSEDSIRLLVALLRTSPTRETVEQVLRVLKQANASTLRSCGGWAALDPVLRDSDSMGDAARDELAEAVFLSMEGGDARSLSSAAQERVVRLLFYAKGEDVFDKDASLFHDLEAPFVRLAVRLAVRLLLATEGGGRRRGLRFLTSLLADAPCVDALVEEGGLALLGGATPACCLASLGLLRACSVRKADAGESLRALVDDGDLVGAAGLVLQAVTSHSAEEWSPLLASLLEDDALCEHLMTLRVACAVFAASTSDALMEEGTEVRPFLSCFVRAVRHAFAAQGEPEYAKGPFLAAVRRIFSHFVTAGTEASILAVEALVATRDAFHIAVHLEEAVACLVLTAHLDLSASLDLTLVDALHLLSASKAISFYHCLRASVPVPPPEWSLTLRCLQGIAAEQTRAWIARAPMHLSVLVYAHDVACLYGDAAVAEAARSALSACRRRRRTVVAAHRRGDLPTPDPFRCPVTLTEMRWPVLCSDEITYELESVLHMFKTNRPVSPLTRRPLSSSFTYNRAVAQYLTDEVEMMHFARQKERAKP